MGPELREVPEPRDVWSCSRRAAGLPTELDVLVVFVLVPEEGGNPFIAGAEDPGGKNKCSVITVQCHHLHQLRHR